MTEKEFLLNCGIACHRVGFYYLTEAIRLRKAQLENNQVELYMGEIYNAVAEKYGSNYTNVERAMRTAIESIYLQPVNDFVEKIFKNIELTNSKFVCVAADYLLESERK